MLRYLGIQEYGVYCTRDITKLGLRNQNLNTVTSTLYAVLDSEFAGCPLAKVVMKVKCLRAILFDLQCRQVEPSSTDIHRQYHCMGG